MTTAATPAPTSAEAEAELTAALREFIDTFYRMDAVERGMRFFNPNHSPTNGQFVSGSGGYTGSGGKTGKTGGKAAKTYASHHWEGKATSGSWDSSMTGATATVDAQGGKATLTVHKPAKGETETYTIEADHEYGGYKMTNNSTGEVEHGLSLVQLDGHIKAEAGFPHGSKATPLKSGKILDSTMLEPKGAKPSKAQQAINKANEQKVTAQKNYDQETKQGAHAALAYTNSGHSVEYHNTDGSMVRVTRNPDDKTYTVETFKAKANSTVTPAESWWNQHEGVNEHSYEDKPASTKVYKTEKGVQGALDKAGTNKTFQSQYLTLHNPASKPSFTSSTSSTTTGVSPHSTKGWKAAMASNLASSNQIAEGGPKGIGIGKYDLQYGNTKVGIVAIGAGKQDVELTYTKPGGKVEIVHAKDAAEAHADLTAHGITDPQAHDFIDFARHDMDTYSGKPTVEQQARIDAVKARKAALDAKYGPYSEQAAQSHVAFLYGQYAGMGDAVEAHLGGGPHLQQSSVSSHLISKGLSKADKAKQAKEGFAKLCEVSEWSLLNHPNVTREGTLRLFHGTNGHSSPQKWEQRLLDTKTRRGTPFTDRWSVARNFADSGPHGRLIISAHVPVEAISIWHGIRSDGMYPHEREYTVGTGAITDHSIITLK